jgi:hypothetical protein
MLAQRTFVCLSNVQVAGASCFGYATATRHWLPLNLHHDGMAHVPSARLSEDVRKDTSLWTCKAVPLPSLVNTAESMSRKAFCGGKR